MGAFSDIVDSFEECCKLITDEKPNKCTMAIILIDALIDIHTHSFLKRQINELRRSISIYNGLSSQNERKNKLQSMLESAEASHNSFQERFEWLQCHGFISNSMAMSIKRLHEYRNQYLHRLKPNENDSVAYAKLYFYLYQQVFIKIPINWLSSTDYETCAIVEQTLQEHKMSFSSEEFRFDIANHVNASYGIIFSHEHFLELLSKFLLDKYEHIIEAMHFIIDACVEKERAIELLEKECGVGKIKITYFGDEEDPIFTVSSSKTQRLLGKIRRIAKLEDEHTGLKTFVETYDHISSFERPVLEKAADLEAYIQHQIDIMRGK